MHDEEDETGQRPGFPVDPGRVLLSLRSGWRLVPPCTLLGALLGVGLALLISHTYRSETVLVWEPAAAKGRPATDLNTQTGILKLPGILEQTRKELGLDTPVYQLADQVVVAYDKYSALVKVVTTAKTATGAAQLADALVEVFLRHQKELARTRAQEEAETLGDELERARGAARAAQQEYDAFRARNDVVDPVSEATMALDAVTKLKTQKATAAAEATALQAQTSQLRELVRKQPRTSVTTARSSNAAEQRLAMARAELSAAETRLAPDHPAILSMKAQIRALERHAADKSAVVQDTTVVPDPGFVSMQSMLSEMKVQQVAATERGKSYDDVLAAAEARLARLSKIEAEARDLIAELQAADSRVKDLDAQLVSAREAARAPTAEFRVLTPAIVPEGHEKSTRRIVAAGMTLLGFFGSIGFLALRPLWGARVHSAREAAYWAKLPVVASTGWPTDENLFVPFVEELSDYAFLNRGTTLILGLDERDEALAVDLARALNPFPQQVTRASSPIEAVAAADDGRLAAEVSESGVAQREASDSAAAERNSPRTDLLALRSTVAPLFFAWRGKRDGPGLRRAVRIADRVIVLMRSGAVTVPTLLGISSRFARAQGMALAILDVPDELRDLPDRVGDVDAFWQTGWVDPAAA